VVDQLPLSDRRALVTGAASDIGRAVCAALTELGAHVVASDLQGAGLEALRQEGVELRPADLSSMPEVVDLCSTPADILVSVAGFAHIERFSASDTTLWDKLWQINLRAPMLLTRELMGPMTERGWGRLVYISSDSARAGAAGEAAYSATKAGLLGFAKSIARELAAAGVTANVLCPGVIDTARSREILDGHGSMREALLRAIPARRLGEPAEVASAVGYLCTPAAAYLTGQVLSVNGGITMV
jgi:2-hydroxycyclohexanecarboxyl-CoA dehydrogenase